MEYPIFTLSDHLTREQIDFFETHGFLHFRPFIDAATVQEILHSAQQVEKTWIADGVEKVNGIPIKYGKDEHNNKIVQRFAFLSQYSPPVRELLHDSRLKALLVLLGSDARIGGNEKDGVVLNHYVNTEHSSFTQMGWHTDCLRDVFYGKKIKPMLNVGVHLCDYPKENGGLRIIPGSHIQSVRQLLFRKLYFKDNNPDPDELGLSTLAGDLTIHDGRLWHRVAKSTVSGNASRRMVMYIPFLTGKYQPKHTYSPTPIYHRFAHLVK